MGETDYNALLYDKMKAEQDKYRDWLLNQPPEEILNHTYEYTMREDIVMCMEELELSPKQAKALLRSPCPLDDVYKEFKDREVEHTFTTRMCEAGVNVKVIQDTLGHKDISTTLNIYTDVTKELRQSEFEGLDSYFKSEYNKVSNE